MTTRRLWRRGAGDDIGSGICFNIGLVYIDFSVYDSDSPFDIRVSVSTLISSPRLRSQQSPSGPVFAYRSHLWTPAASGCRRRLNLVSDFIFGLRRAFYQFDFVPPGLGFSDVPPVVSARAQPFLTFNAGYGASGFFQKRRRDLYTSCFFSSRLLLVSVCTPAVLCGILFPFDRSLPRLTTSEFCGGKRS